jgi:hypothetical protein
LARPIGNHRLIARQGRPEECSQVAKLEPGQTVRLVQSPGLGAPGDVGDGLRLEVGLTRFVPQHLADKAIFAVGEFEDLIEQIGEERLSRHAGNEFLLAGADDFGHLGGRLLLAQLLEVVGSIPGHAQIADGFPRLVPERRYGEQHRHATAVFPKVRPGFRIGRLLLERPHERGEPRNRLAVASTEMDGPFSHLVGVVKRHRRGDSDHLGLRVAEQLFRGRIECHDRAGW